MSKEADKHLETIVNSIPQIYTVTHSFSSDSIRSKQVVNETLMLEVAQLTDDNLNDLMDQVEYFVKKLTTNYVDLHPHVVNMLRGERGPKFSCKLEKTDFDYLRLTYEEALELLSKKEIKVEYGEQLTIHHKTEISNYFECYPVFIYDYPFELKKDFDTLNIDNKVSLLFLELLEQTND